MGNLKEIRTRIASVRSTQQITKAMKLVSASKLRKAQDKILQMRPYSGKLKEIIGNLSDNIGDSKTNVYYEKRKIKKVLVLPVTSDRGLCGSFNSTINKLTLKHIQDNYGNTKANVELFCIGKKGWDFMKRRDVHIFDKDLDIFSNLNYKNSAAISSMLMERYENKEFDRIDIIYNKFKNAVTNIPTIEQFLPIEESLVDELQENEKKQNTNFIFEPSKEAIINELIPKSLQLTFFRILLDSNAAEHGARMSAMDQATDNAEELLDNLRLTYNKERQAAITKEILEIVSGANALEQ